MDRVQERNSWGIVKRNEYKKDWSELWSLTRGKVPSRWQVVVQYNGGKWGRTMNLATLWGLEKQNTINIQFN